ncbi:YueI family protein [Candidatus Enterococcus courvalinii]|uniref:YueI family protein n=1 Tax=Candidatus Enterococcus courvalinii TaxID=2815329 RepID=A0ABS3I085_9ENTE|nr:YueI family protein [Enterococcus sp. MSG2901]MBO0482122.1 YueI family protein [Enterococcus sp. MSG2901]
MPQDELQSHLDKGRYGTPLVNPEEQHKYLGTFRERCYVSMTIGEMKKAENQANFLKELEKYPDEQILLNGSMSEDLQARYIQLATKQKVRFTVINDFVKNDDDSLGLILTAKEAVNEPVIDIEKKYPKEQESEQSEKPKKSLWDKLFH